MNFIDICSGIGGFRSALENNGHNCLAFAEIDKYAKQSYRAMILSDTVNIRYKYKTGGMNTKEMAQLLKYHGFYRGFISIIAVLPEDKAYNRKVLNELKGVMASE
ncbi:DNA cytosine methyltransferase [Staphylococcus aureus]|uniref:DNA cytosine methyltransferase n=1 Tax=Staphylococcus aureus TaxID=1280 RepID=UPI001F0D972B|nr:DNA cytosine methyltransferase [Staphylococcus aureus]